MKCSDCGRELKEDSKFCDQCGTIVSRPAQEKAKQGLNIRLLFAGIIFSILITLIVTGLAKSLGIPLIFGGLFLPFFWFSRKKQQK